TVGLASKNPIMVLESARNEVEEGIGLANARVMAARIRLPPIVMRPIACGLGVLPLALNTGAGAGSQNAIGTGVFGGTFAATALGIFFIPVFFTVVRRVFARKPKSAPVEHIGSATTEPEA